MPIYEYECEKCGHRFEKIQKFSDALLASGTAPFWLHRQLLLGDDTGDLL